MFNLKGLISKPSCFQSTNPASIYFILTNKKDHLVTEISDHQHFVTTALRNQ